MPDDTAALVVGAVLGAGWVVQQSPDCFVDCPILLVTGDEFDGASATGFEQGEVSQDVEEVGRVQHPGNEHLAGVE
jgi:hypothetical protein